MFKNTFRKGTTAQRKEREEENTTPKLTSYCDRFWQMSEMDWQSSDKQPYYPYVPTKDLTLTPVHFLLGENMNDCVQEITWTTHESSRTHNKILLFTICFY